MKINSIKLQNFRSHTNFETEFNAGINLLLGKNGAGKSSILEAIGLALFDAKPRTKLEETIKIGNKFTVIDISFQANDGNIYRVERKIGQGAFLRLYANNESTPRYTADNTKIFIKELVGLDTNSDVIYKNIITAEQNKLTDIFQLTEAKRAEEFNKIFDTAIYREIYSKYSFKVLADYLNQLQLANNSISIHKSNLKNSEELNSSLNNLKSELNDSEKEDEIIIKKIAELEIQKQEIESEIDKIKKLKNEISSKNSRINDIERMLAKLNEDLISANNSLNIVKSNFEFYEKYQTLNNQLNLYAEKIKNLEKIESKKRKVENEIIIEEKDLYTLTVKITTNNDLIDSKSNENISIAEKIQADNDNLNLIDSQLREVNYKIQIINKTKADFNNLLAIRNRKLNEIDSISKLINTKNSNLIDENEIRNLILVNQEKLNIFDIQKIEKVKLETEKEQLNERNKILKEAKAKLKGSICPYFDSKCKNIDDNLNSNSFFDTKTDEINRELAIINDRLKSLKSIEKDTDICKNEINQLNNQILNNKNLQLEIEKYKSSLNVLYEELKTNLSEIELAYSNHTIPFNFDRNNLELSFNNLNLQFNEFNNLLTELHTNKKNVEKNISELSKKSNSIKAEINKLNLENTANSKQISNINDSLLTKKSEVMILEEQVINLPNLKSENEIARKEAEKIKPQFILYTKNFENSQKVKSLSEQITIETNLKSAIATEIINLNFELNKTDQSEIESKFGIIIESIKSSNEKRRNITAKIATAKSEIANLINDLNENYELENKIKLLENETTKLDRKIQLTNKFRDNVNSMGTIVAGRLLLEIARKAGENYQRISGKAETIEWINNETDKYQVYLIDNATKVRRKFELLSGGEQVSVAIAIRTALAQSLTSANFAIFDEPTVNLDVERKDLLSRSLHYMLENLEQVLIVTHDDTFREMAEAIEIG